MMPDIFARLTQAHRNLLERVSLEKTQAQRLPLLNRQLFEGLLKHRITDVRFQTFIVEGRGERTFSSRGAVGNFSRRVEAPARQIAPSRKGTLVAHLDKYRTDGSLRR